MHPGNLPTNFFMFIIQFVVMLISKTYNCGLMEYLKQFEMNKIGLFNKHVKLPKKVYTCKWHIQETTFHL
jgi:hypothetical protein